MTTEKRISIRYGILKEHANFAAKAVLCTAADGNAFCFWRIEFVFDLSSCPTDESMDPLPTLKTLMVYIMLYVNATDIKRILSTICLFS